MRGQPLTKEQEALQKTLQNLQPFQDQLPQEAKQVHTHSSLQAPNSISQEPHRHNQQIQVMEKEFQAVIRGYEIKLKNVGEEYKRFKHEMEIKIKELYQEKNHWHNLAIENSGKMEHTHNFHKIKEKSEQQNNEKLLHFELEKQKEKIETIEKEKRHLQKEKEGYSKELERLKSENNNLKITVSEHVREICKLKYIHPPIQKIEQKNQRALSVSPPSQPYPQQREFENLKSICEKYKKMLMEMNEQTVITRITKLNEKYSRTNTINFNSTQARGIYNPANLVSDPQRVYSHSQGVIVLP